MDQAVLHYYSKIPEAAALGRKKMFIRVMI